MQPMLTLRWLRRRGVRCECMGNGHVGACSGADSRKFIQGLTTNDMNALGPDNPVMFAAILSPKVRQRRPMVMGVRARALRCVAHGG